MKKFNLTIFNSFLVGLLLMGTTAFAGPIADFLDGTANAVGSVTHGTAKAAGKVATGTGRVVGKTAHGTAHVVGATAHGVSKGFRDSGKHVYHHRKH